MRNYLNKTFPNYSEVDLTGFPDEAVKITWKQMARGDGASSAKVWDLIDYMERHRSSPYVAQAARDAYVFLVRGVNIYPAYKIVSEQKPFFNSLPLDSLLSCGRAMLASSAPYTEVVELFREFNLIHYGIQL